MRTAWVLAALLGAVYGPAGPAAADQQNPREDIEQLELAGYYVNIDRIGNKPIGECVVTGIRNPQQQTEFIDDDGHGRHDGGRGVIEVVVRQTISVSLDCTG
jgi:hypothetical protein